MANLTAAEAAEFDNSSPANQNARVGEKLKTAQEEIDTLQSDVSALQGGGYVYQATATLTAAAAATPIHIIPAASVPAGKKIKILSMLLVVNGATAWTDTTATIVSLQDTAGSPVNALSIAKAGLTGNAKIDLVGSNVTLGTPIKAGTGLTADKGLDIVADADFAAGSDIKVTVVAIFI